MQLATPFSCLEVSFTELIDSHCPSPMGYGNIRTNQHNNILADKASVGVFVWPLVSEKMWRVASLFILHTHKHDKDGHLPCLATCFLASQSYSFDWASRGRLSLGLYKWPQAVRSFLTDRREILACCLLMFWMTYISLHDFFYRLLHKIVDSNPGFHRNAIDIKISQSK